MYGLGLALSWRLLMGPTQKLLEEHYLPSVTRKAPLALASMGLAGLCHYHGTDIFMVMKKRHYAPTHPGTNCAPGIPPIPKFYHSIGALMLPIARLRTRRVAISNAIELAFTGSWSSPMATVAANAQNNDEIRSTSER